MDIQEVAEQLPDDQVAVEEVQEAQGDPYADEAVKYGWKPAEDWVGDSGHMSAEKYMTRGPGLNRKQQEQIEALQSQLSEVSASVESRIGNTERALKAAADARVEAERNRITQEMRYAAEQGDMAKYDELDQKRDKVAAAPASNEPSAEDRQAVEMWIANNPNYKTDFAFQGLVNGLWQKAEKDGLTDPRAILQSIDNQLPNYGHGSKPEAPKPKPVAVETGGTAPVKRRGRGWQDIPSEDRKMAMTFIERGDFDSLAEKGKTSPQEAYAASYWSQDQ